MKKIYLIVFSILLLSSCKQLDMVFHPGDYIPRDSPREFEYIRDTVYMFNNNGVAETATKGIASNKKLIFTGTGQSYTFKSGEAIEIVLDGVDMSISTFDVITNDENGDITFKLVDKDTSKVILQNKCQTVVRNSVNVIPKIELAPGMKPEQIVVTPMFNDDCEKTGYQIRYGSTESGCRKEAKEVLRRFKDCEDGNIGNNRSKGSKVICEECRIKKKLGIPCKCK